MYELTSHFLYVHSESGWVGTENIFRVSGFRAPLARALFDLINALSDPEADRVSAIMNAGRKMDQLKRSRSDLFGHVYKYFRHSYDQIDNRKDRYDFFEQYRAFVDLQLKANAAFDDLTKINVKDHYLDTGFPFAGEARRAFEELSLTSQAESAARAFAHYLMADVDPVQLKREREDANKECMEQEDVALEVVRTFSKNPLFMS